MSDKVDFDYFMSCLIKAGTKIDSHYFKLPVAGAEKPIFREQVYCYELYHQLRCILGDDFPYKLDGEVDKAAHPILKGAKKPDFIVHVPGTMDRNLVVIEVKSANEKTRINGIRADLQKLRSFLDTAKYYRAIMLVYGDSESSLPKRVRCEIDSLPREHAEHILLIWHKKPNAKPEVIK